MKERQVLAHNAHAFGRLMGWSRVFRKYMETFMSVVKPVEEERTLQQERVLTLPFQV